MPRVARIVVPGYPHHVVQRGGRRLDVFFSDEDRMTYLQWLRTACDRCGVAIWAYCLMRNHVHLIAVPEREDSLARCLSDAHVRYARRVNARHGWRGHLWQERFWSSVMDERYLVAAVRYVERNPVRAKLVDEAWRYPWSSAAWHVGDRATDPLVSGNELLGGLIDDWRNYLDAEENPREIATIRRETRGSRPLGNDEFVSSLESRLNRRLRRGRVGRPKRIMSACP